MIVKSFGRRRVHLSAYYNAKFVREMHKLGATWLSAHKVWAVPADNESAADALCRRIFGIAPALPGQVVPVPIRITLDDVQAWRGSVTFYSRAVAILSTPTGELWPASNCHLISGEWRAIVRDDGSFLTQLDAGFAIDILDAHPAHVRNFAGWTVEPLTDALDDAAYRALLHERRVLAAEQAALNPRISDIDAAMQAIECRAREADMRENPASYP